MCQPLAHLLVVRALHPGRFRDQLVEPVDVPPMPDARGVDAHEQRLQEIELGGVKLAARDAVVDLLPQSAIAHLQRVVESRGEVAGGPSQRLPARVDRHLVVRGELERGGAEQELRRLDPQRRPLCDQLHRVRLTHVG